MISIWTSFVDKFALILVLFVVWDLVSDLVWRLSKRAGLLLFGLFMGVGALISMVTSQIHVSGFVFDLRSVFIAASGFFGGPLAMAMATIISVSCRLYIGGAGAPSGLVNILVAASIGLVFYSIAWRRGRTAFIIFGFAVATTLSNLTAFVMYPADLRTEAFQQIAPMLASFAFISSFIIAMLLDRQLHHLELFRENLIYGAMVRELPDPLNMKDVEGRFIVANPATAALMRAGSVKNLIGKTDFDFYPKEIAEQLRKDDLTMIESGKLLRVDQQTILADGSSGCLSTTKTPFRDGSGKIAGIITYSRDVTAQRHASKIKDEFISSVSHELRTPLTSIRGSLGLIAGGVAGEVSAKVASLVKIAHSNCERLIFLVNDILDMEKIRADKMTFEIRRMPILPILEAAITSSAHYMTEKRVRFVLIDNAPRAEANVDPNRLQQVIANLLSNAIKFSPANGTVTVQFQR